jgi:predicted nuclease with TOPRIM domain
METITKVKGLIRTLVDVIKAPSELKKVKKELEQTRKENDTRREKNLELAEEFGKLKGELSAKTKEFDRLNREIAWKNDEILRLQEEFTALKANFEEKVRVETEKRLHYYIPTLITEITNDFISKHLTKSWMITCDKCHSEFLITLTSEQIASLIKNGCTHVECLNKNCVDGFLIYWPHRIFLKLDDFVGSVTKEKFGEVYNEGFQRY